MDLPHVNLIFCGHVDAGKSTTCGHIIVLTNQIDPRTIEKLKADAKAIGRESWWLAHILDENDEERERGITVEVGRARFQTANRRYTILDCPGHKNYVPNMLKGAAQADVAILIVSARKGEFETGFDRGGQTREHALLAKTLGVNHLIVAVNKMDESTVNWDPTRFVEIQEKMTPYLRSIGFITKLDAPRRDCTFIQISGYTGANIQTPRINGSPSLFELMDSIPMKPRDSTKPLRIPVLDSYDLNGSTVVLGKVESGKILQCNQQSLVIIPGDIPATITEIKTEFGIVVEANPGDNVYLRLKGTESSASIHQGSVICTSDAPVSYTNTFTCQVYILDLMTLETSMKIVNSGCEFVMHIHTEQVECEITRLISILDPTTGKPMKKKPVFAPGKSTVTCEIKTTRKICCETYASYPQLGRFALRNSGNTIGIGKILTIS